MFRRIFSTGVVGIPPASLSHVASYRHSLDGIPLLVIPAAPVELVDIEVEHVARLIDAEGDVVADAIVKHIDRSSTPNVLVLKPTTRLPELTVAVEVDLSSRWPYSIPRRGGALPGAKPLIAPTERNDDARGERRPTNLNPFAPRRPDRPCAPPTPATALNIVNDAHPDRTPLIAHDVGLQEWEAWQLATTVSVRADIVHRWRVDLKLMSHAALDQPFHIQAPIKGHFEPVANLRPGQVVTVGDPIGRVALDPVLAQQLRAAASSSGRDEIRRVSRLLPPGIASDVADELLVDPIGAIDVTAPLSGIVHGISGAGNVEVGQSLATLTVPSHTMAYGQLPGQEPMPVCVGISLSVRTARFQATGLPLVDRSKSRRTFAIQLPINLPSNGAAWTSAELFNVRSSGVAIGVPKDTMMRIGKSKEVLLHSGPRQVMRKPVQVLYQEGDQLYLDPASLPVGAALVRDIEAVAARFPKVAGIMTGLILF